MFRKLSTEERIRNEELERKQSDINLNAEDANLGIDLSEREIQEIIQGQQISELEIMILGGK